MVPALVLIRALDQLQPHPSDQLIPEGVLSGNHWHSAGGFRLIGRGHPSRAVLVQALAGNRGPWFAF
ncbi:hypothetical protein [Kibdelosporangium philippinense]|uniref:hypothetical protein n=1 Tax=Kibdelosporangium philippinense TaxID=211113 RepID=UPI003615F8E9